MMGAQLYYELASGYKMPMFGLGTYLLNNKKIIMTVLDEALSAGYRLIDTAAMYGNEESIGIALKKLLPKHGLSRQDIFLISKLPPTDHGHGAIDCLVESLNRLQCDYLDLYLIHWPGSPEYDPKDLHNSVLREQSWIRLVEAKQAGLVRSLGVSNYCLNHLTELVENCHGERPTVNQIEWHAHWHPNDVIEYCRAQGIMIQAYFTFGGSENKTVLRDPAITSIADKIGKTPAQVLLRWTLQQSVAVIPKATSRSHIQANIDLDFVIIQEYMDQLSSLPQTRYGCDPSAVV